MGKRRKTGWTSLLVLCGTGLLGAWLLPSAKQPDANTLVAKHQLLGPTASASATDNAQQQPGFSPAKVHRPTVTSDNASNSSGKPSQPLNLLPENNPLRQRVLRELSLRTEPAPATAGKWADAKSPEPGTMVDRTGSLNRETLAIINRELIPMIDGCLEQAQEREPNLEGLLALDLTLAGVAEVGGIVETLQAARANQLKSPELLECVRQSAFSLELPLPDGTGRNQLQLTVPFGESPDAGNE